ncbi:14 kDa phosphohistidine phosphatase-like [Colletes gigas]|uniref:14 kDa phosphohistidine phosphatase-like n=1 Tax=Colletes gigas TaxID=935657 RepID=UPI001C9AAF91|nr:14 kDa phosphohistidine phosphatase-like [Colletes gigas]
MTATFNSFGNGASNIRHLFFKVLTNNRRFGIMSQSLDALDDVDIDIHGKFKYILAKVEDKDKNVSKFIVRGYIGARWHADIYDMFSDEWAGSRSLYAKCVGGGRIIHDCHKKTIHVYGDSQGFGKADHEMSADILKKKFTDYKITWSNEGY